MSFWLGDTPWSQTAASRTVDATPRLRLPPTSALTLPLPIPGTRPVSDSLSRSLPSAFPENPVPAHASAVSLISELATDVPSLVPALFPGLPPPPSSTFLSSSFLTGLRDKLMAVYATVRQSILVELHMPTWIAHVSVIVSGVVGPYRNVLIFACMAVHQSPFAELVLPQSVAGGGTLTVKDLLTPFLGDRDGPFDPIEPAVLMAKKTFRSQAYIRNHPMTPDNILRPESVFTRLEPVVDALRSSRWSPILLKISLIFQWFGTLLRTALSAIGKLVSMLPRPLQRALDSQFHLLLPFSALEALDNYVSNGPPTYLIFRWFRALLWAALPSIRSTINVRARWWFRRFATMMPRWPREFVEALLPPPIPFTLFIEAFDNYISNELPTHLIRLQDMRLVGRDDIREALQSRIATMTEADLTYQTLCYNLLNPNNQVGHHFTLAIQRYLKFAIFSHRWGPQEPTFRAMMEAGPEASSVLTQGPGVQKLLKFCGEARRYGCAYAWSDTCCINKESSSELQEAIRSMYRWYKNAEICIAYLGESISEEDFEYEPWFTRGWTLQELLAPRRIRFYGKYWTPINRGYSLANDKLNSTLMEAIEKVTMIPQADLREFAPSCLRVYEKMIWASKRRTTRVEDTAYCLLGIFDITMPISYGEGSWAFHRLMEVILQRCGESGILAWLGETSPHSLAIPASPACYTGDLRKVENTLRLTESVEFTVTKDGLDVELFVVNAKMTSAHRRGKGSQLPWDDPWPSLSLADVRFHDIVLRPKWTFRRNWLKKAVQVSADERDLQRCSTWAIGIVCSRDADGYATLEAGKEYMWLLIGRVGTGKKSVWMKSRTRSIPTLLIERAVRSRLETVHIPHRWKPAVADGGKH